MPGLLEKHFGDVTVDTIRVDTKTIEERVEATNASRKKMRAIIPLSYALMHAFLDVKNSDVDRLAKFEAVCRDAHVALRNI